MSGDSLGCDHSHLNSLPNETRCVCETRMPLKQPFFEKCNLYIWPWPLQMTLTLGKREIACNKCIITEKQNKGYSKIQTCFQKVIVSQESTGVIVWEWVKSHDQYCWINLLHLQLNIKCTCHKNALTRNAFNKLCVKITQLRSQKKKSNRGT